MKTYETHTKLRVDLMKQDDLEDLIKARDKAVANAQTAIALAKSAQDRADQCASVIRRLRDVAGCPMNTTETLAATPTQHVEAILKGLGRMP